MAVANTAVGLALPAKPILHVADPLSITIAAGALDRCRKEQQSTPNRFAEISQSWSLSSLAFK
jgi:hypothetical protein